MKKLVSLVIVMALVLSLAVGAAAADDTTSITINPNLPADGSITGTGETFTAYKIFDATYEGTLDEDSNIAYTIDSKNNPFYKTIRNSSYFTLTQINNSDIYKVEKNDSFDNTAAVTLATALKQVITADTDSAGTSTYSDGKYTISVADKGYYLITSSLGSKMVVDTLGNVTINTKNSYPSLTKSADKTTAAFGEEVTFSIPVVIPESAVGAITVHDTLNNMTYVENTTSADNNVTITTTSTTTDNCSLEFSISADDVAANIGKTVTITYRATVNANATEATNTAYLTYSAFKSASDTVTVKNYQIDVYKYDGDTNEGLPGAGFVLKNAEGNYYKNESGIVSWVTDIDQATEMKTAENAYTVSFTGLANGTYTLVEKTVPAGYTQATDTKVEIEDASKTGDAKIPVENKSGSVLPSTGGVGTTIFYALGGLMFVGALVLLVTNKRMKAE